MLIVWQLKIMSPEKFLHFQKNEGEHLDWLETRLELIEQIGIQNYFQSQTRPTLQINVHK